MNNKWNINYDSTGDAESWHVISSREVKYAYLVE